MTDSPAAHAGVSGITLSGSGVYVVCLDPDITGIENIVWAFDSERDADVVVRAAEGEFGGGRAWHTYEPVSLSLDEPDLREYFRSRFGCTDRTLTQLLAAAGSA